MQTNVITALSRATLVILVYIGNKEFKEDNVCGTGVVWHGYGDKQEVDQRFLPKFLQHPDVWCTEEAFEKLPQKISNLDDKKYTPRHNPDGTITLIPVVESANSSPAPVTPSAPETPSAPTLENPNPEIPPQGDGELGSETETKITNAILSLEQGNDKHFSKSNGVPILAAVRAAASDESITGEQVKAAWTKLNAN